MADKSNKFDGKLPFEAAIDKAGYGLYSHIMTGLTGITIISFVCIVFSSTIIVPTSACELGTTSSQQGLLAAGPVVGSLLGGILWGYQADTRGRRKMLLVSLCGGIIVNLIASISVNWIMLMIFQFIAALFASGLYSMSMSLLSESVPMGKRNLVVLLVSSIFLLSQGLMAALAIPIIPLSFSYYLPALGIYWNSWRTLLVVYSSPSIITLIWMYLMQESPKFMVVKGRELEALEILRVIHRVNNFRSKEEFGVLGLLQEPGQQAEAGASVKEQVGPLFRMPLLKYTIIMTTLFVINQTGAFLVWLPTIADQFVRILQTGENSDLNMCQIINTESQVDESATPCSLNVTSLLIVLGVGAMQSVCNIVISIVVNWAGRRNIVMVVTALCGVSGLLVNLVPNAIGSAVLFGILVIGVIVVGLYTAITVSLFPTQLRALAIALAMTGGRIGTFASIQILNLMLVNSCDAGFYLFSSLFAISAIVASFLPDDRRTNVAAVESASINKEDDQNNELGLKNADD
ncbi:solute carrier family 22 member 6-like [Trichoplusia ni]|uniref:Solute carrier family 22 member 6-like n=1 Tax=Trichoplusia ni TaxID=7111 RepID=A0A7E5VFV3_TRINI|nr:solute carrier family 22 member 6-like [Trichoplusia ni]